jgi:MoxR-like ATPase
MSEDSNPAPPTNDEVALAEKLIQAHDKLKEEVHKIIVGQDEVIEQILLAVFCRGHCLMVGVPGLAKTALVNTIGKALALNFARIQFTPDLMPSDITGTEILQSDDTGQRRSLVFHRGPIFANLILADEINRTPPKTQAALLEAMQELAVTVNGKTYRMEPPFIVVATQNPIEQEGTYPLPEAQLDRFMLSIHVGYPSRTDELAIAARPLRAPASGLKPVATREEFRNFQSVIDAMPVSPDALEHAVAIAAGSRPKQEGVGDFVKRYVAWGAGPRATQHLITAAKTWAFLDGRPTPELRDLRAVAGPVLRHRIIPNYNALGEGIEADAIIQHILDHAGISLKAA